MEGFELLTEVTAMSVIPIMARDAKIRYSSSTTAFIALYSIREALQVS